MFSFELGHMIASNLGNAMQSLVLNLVKSSCLVLYFSSKLNFAFLNKLNYRPHRVELPARQLQAACGRPPEVHVPRVHPGKGSGSSVACSWHAGNCLLELTSLSLFISNWIHFFFQLVCIKHIWFWIITHVERKRSLSLRITESSWMPFNDFTQRSVSEKCTQRPLQ